MVVLLLLLMSGDIETNPGPVGEWTSLMCKKPIYHLMKSIDGLYGHFQGQESWSVFSCAQNTGKEVLH